MRICIYIPRDTYCMYPFIGYGGIISKNSELDSQRTPAAVLLYLAFESLPGVWGLEFGIESLGFRSRLNKV